MRIPGLKTAKHFSRWFRARLFGGAMILGYHRIAGISQADDPYEVCVSPQFFCEQMEIIRRHYHPVSLTELVRGLVDGNLPPRSVAVTFDDGYLDNLHTALPVLEKNEIPATVFVCTGYSGKAFWWDELVCLVMESQSCLPGLCQQLEQSQAGWDTPAWFFNPLDGIERTRRQKLHQQIYQYLFHKDIDVTQQVMQIIREWAQQPAAAPESRRLMDQSELIALTRSGLVTLGSHTRSHPYLPDLTPKRQKEEIIGGKLDLEALIGRTVNGFAYPNGKFTAATEQVVRNAGFQFACISLHDVVRPGCDLHRLTRFWQKNVDGEQFHRGLSLWVS